MPDEPEETPEEKSSPYANLALGDYIPAVSPRFGTPVHLQPVLDIFARIMAGESVRVVISTPPRHGKTETILHGIVWLLLAQPHLQIAYASYAQRFAENKSRKARTLARRSLVPIARDQSSRSNWRTGIDDGGLWTTSLGGPITGEGFHVFVGDDLIKGRAMAESSVHREALWEWFNSDAFTRLEPEGSCIINGTRWHPEDVPGRLIAQGWEHVNLQAINGKGEALWPSRWPVPVLRRIESQIGDYDFCSLYQGNPRRRGSRLFGDVHFYDALPAEGYRITIGVDLAYTEKSSSDYSVAVVLASRKTDILLPDGTPAVICYVVDVIRRQQQADDFALELQNLAKKYRGARFHMYCSTTERGTAKLMNTFGGVPIAGQLATADKFVRAQPVAAAWKHARVLLPKEAPWLDDFVREVTLFTGIKDTHDDQVDALASAFDASCSDSTSNESSIGAEGGFEEIGIGL